MEEIQPGQLSTPPRDLLFREFLLCSSPSVCYLNKFFFFLSSHGCFCSIINSNSFGNSSSCLKCRPRYSRLLVLLLEAVQILCSSFLFSFHRHAFGHGPKTSFFLFFFESFYNKTLSQSRQIFQFIFESCHIYFS